MPAREHGFTLIEVLVGMMILVVALFALLGMMDVGNRVNAANRVRQAATSLGREATEDARSLAYTGLTPSALPGELQALIPQSTVSGSNLVVNRGIYTFTLSFTACSLDDPSNGYGDHSQPPQSGGAWCPDVAASGTTDPQPDDMKRVSVTVVSNGVNAPTTSVQETVLIYRPTLAGPAVSCLSTTAACPGSNVVLTDPTVTSLTFNVTTTAPAESVQWYVDGNPPPANEIPAGASDPYSPAYGSTTSSFTWDLPATSSGVYIDGTYTISAVGYDFNGHSGTRSTLQIVVNRHQVIAPTTLNAGWDTQLSGVDVQWVPSVDQDVLYYDVYHQVGTGTPTLVTGCTHVTGTSCSDLNAPSPNPPAAPTTCQSSATSYTTSNIYWVVGVDTDPSTGQPRESTAPSPKVDANLCDHAPYAPTNLTGTVSGTMLTLNWTAPSGTGDPDSWDQIQAWRVYRWAPGGSTQFPGSRLQLLGTLNSSGGALTSAIDNSPDPGGVAQNYCVTSVDTHLNESPCSNTFTG